MENKQIENPLSWSKSAEFLCSYSWEGKSKEQIVKEMALREKECKYLDDAMNMLAPKGKYTGMDLDEYFVLRMSIDENDVELEEDDIIWYEE